MAMTPEQQAKANAAVTANPSIGRRRLMAACGCTNYAAASFLKRGSMPTRATSLADPIQAPLAVSPKPVKPGISVRDFASRFDFEAKLRKTLKELCQDKFVSEYDIRNCCDIPMSSFKTVASLPEFTACQIKDSGTVWWSTKENVDVVRAQASRWGISK